MNRHFSVEYRADDVPVIGRWFKYMLERGHLPRFAGGMDASDSAWQCLCDLEDDYLAYARKNRWAEGPDGFYIAVGTCAVLPAVPSYNEWGRVASWLLYGSYVIVLDPPGARIVVWREADFYDQNAATLRTSHPFADDSAIYLNRILKAFARLES